MGASDLDSYDSEAERGEAIRDLAERAALGYEGAIASLMGLPDAEIAKMHRDFAFSRYPTWLADTLADDDHQSSSNAIALGLT